MKSLTQPANLNVSQYGYSWLRHLTGPPPLFQCEHYRFINQSCFQLSLWDIIVHASEVEFTAQTLSLSYFNGDSIRWHCNYKIRVLSEQNDSLETPKATWRWHVGLTGWFSVTIGVGFHFLTKEKEKYADKSSFIVNSAVLMLIYT